MDITTLFWELLMHLCFYRFPNSHTWPLMALVLLTQQYKQIFMTDKVDINPMMLSGRIKMVLSSWFRSFRNLDFGFWLLLFANKKNSKLWEVWLCRRFSKCHFESLMVKIIQHVFSPKDYHLFIIIITFTQLLQSKLSHLFLFCSKFFLLKS